MMLLESIAAYGVWSIYRDIVAVIRARKRPVNDHPVPAPVTFGPRGTPVYRGPGGRFTREPPTEPIYEPHYDEPVYRGVKMSVTDFEVVMRGRTTELGG